MFLKRVCSHLRAIFCIGRFLLLVFFLLGGELSAQGKSDSLWLFIHSDRHPDTVSVNWLNKTAASLFLRAPDSTRKLAEVALRQSIRLSYLKGMAYSTKLVGNFFLMQGKIDSANIFFDRATNLALQIEDRSLLAKLYNDKAICNARSSQFINSMDYFLQSLKINRELGDTVLMSKCLSNIGLIFTKLELYEPAIPYFQEALQLARQSGNKEILAGSLLSIGTVYFGSGEFANALRVFDEGMRIKQEIGDKKGISICLNYKGLIALSNDSVDQAEAYFYQSMTHLKELGDQEGLITIYSGLASVSLRKKQIAYAVKYNRMAEDLVMELGISDGYFKILELYAQIYEQSGDYVKAYGYLVQARQFNDSINNLQSKQEVVQKSLSYQLENKELQRNIEQKRKELVLQDKRFSTQLLLLAVVIILLLLLLVLFLLKINRIRRKSQEELQIQQRETDYARKRLENIFSEMSDVVWSERLPDHQTLFFTPSAKVMLESDEEDLMKIPGFWRNFILAEDKVLIAQMNRDIEQGKGFDRSFRIQTRKGRFKWVNNKAKVIRDEFGAPLRVDGILRDITRQKLDEAAFVAAREQAEEASRIKSSFLANMSHEIRTPLNSVMGFSELMGQSPLNEKQKEYMAAILSSSRSLMELLNDVLDFSKIEAGKLELHPVRLDLRDFCSRLLEDVRLKASEKGLTCHLTLPETGSLQVFADEMRLQQILMNLLINATKFTAEGAIQLELISEQMDNYLHVTFKVRDTGIGIAKENHEKIFQAFVQADNSTTRQYGGTGLGLAIASSLLLLMGSKLELESEEGKGSCFYFQLKLLGLLSTSKIEEIKPKWNKLAVGRLLKVIVADDHSLNRSLARHMLTELFEKVEIREVENGPHALDEFIKECPDLLLLDLQMPLWSGYETAQRIRMLEKNKTQKCVMIAITAGALSGEREKCLRAGMDGYLAKPVSIEFLHAILLPFFEEKKSVSTSLQSTGTQGLNTYHRERLFSLFSGNEELIAEVERLICSGVFEKYLSQLSDLLSSNDSPGQVQKLAHTIKGTSLNAGLERMAALAAELDQQNLPDLEEGKKVLQHLREELENVLKEIKKDTTLS